MAETTGIAWTDATQNFWEGCTKVGPGCDHCYAENRDQRFHGGSHWGPGAPRRRMEKATFYRPIVWNKARALADLHGDAVWQREHPRKPLPPRWVFSLSLGDFFDNEVPPEWRAEAWDIIKACQHLRWQIVTKRVGNVPKMLPADWGDGSAYQHVGIISTVVTQAEANRDVHRLMMLKRDNGVKWVGLSIEPQLEHINLRNVGPDMTMKIDALTGEASHFMGMRNSLPPIDWVICGGESRQGHGHTPRSFNPGWARSMLADCQIAGVPFFMKQMGDAYGLRANAGADPEEWPEDLRVRQMPRIYEAA